MQMMNRRLLLQRIAAAGATSFLGESLAVEMARAAAARPVAAATNPPLRTALMPTLTALCGLIIPKTDTAGAIEAGVPGFVKDMAVHWMTRAERDAFEEALQRLDRERFAAAGREEQVRLFSTFRDEAKGWRPKAGFGMGARIADPAAPFFHKARDLVTIGYFTSEAGVTQELAYVPVPGKFEGDVDVKTWHRQMQL